MQRLRWVTPGRPRSPAGTWQCLQGGGGAGGGWSPARAGAADGVARADAERAPCLCPRRPGRNGEDDALAARARARTRGRLRGAADAARRGGGAPLACRAVGPPGRRRAGTLRRAPCGAAPRARGGRSPAGGRRLRCGRAGRCDRPALRAARPRRVGAGARRGRRRTVARRVDGVGARVRAAAAGALRGGRSRLGSRRRPNAPDVSGRASGRPAGPSAAEAAQRGLDSRDRPERARLGAGAADARQGRRGERRESLPRARDRARAAPDWDALGRRAPPDPGGVAGARPCPPRPAAARDERRAARRCVSELADDGPRRRGGPGGGRGGGRGARRPRRPHPVRPSAARVRRLRAGTRRAPARDASRARAPGDRRRGASAPPRVRHRRPGRGRRSERGGGGATRAMAAARPTRRPS